MNSYITNTDTFLYIEIQRVQKIPNKIRISKKICQFINDIKKYLNLNPIMRSQRGEFKYFLKSKFHFLLRLLYNSISTLGEEIPINWMETAEKVILGKPRKVFDSGSVPSWKTHFNMKVTFLISGRFFNDVFYYYWVSLALPSSAKWNF